MALPAFRKLVTADSALSRLQDTLTEVFNWIRRREVLDGILLKNIDIATSSTAVNHGLGRAPEGYIVVRANAGATVHQISANSSALNLQASTSVTVDLWVF